MIRLAPRRRAFHLLPLSAILAMPVFAQQACSPPSNLIHTHAMAHTRLPNTVADGSLGITADGSTVAAVTKELGTRSQQLMAYLRNQHAERLATDQISVEPKMHTAKGGPDQVVGYSGRVNVSFRTTADKAGELVTGALSNGANTLEQVTFSPREEEIEAAMRTLAIDATKTAMAQADAVAKAAGEHIVSVRDIAVDPEGSTLRTFAPRMMAMQAQAAPVLPVSTAAGEQEASITVNVEVNIAN